MASEEEDDLEALRLAALATLKKKPSAAEDAQPIPQLTSSAHSLHNSKSPWAEDFNFDTVPFEDEQPIPQFPNRTWEQQQPAPSEFGQNSPTHYSQNNWRGRGKFQRPYMRGPFPPGQRVPFGQNQRMPFGPRMQFSRIQRPFPQNTRLPFNPTQRPPPFNQNPLPFSGTPPFGGAGGGGGNLIVINTLPEEGEQPKGTMPPGQQLPFAGSANHRGRGVGPVRGRGRGMNIGRGSANAGVGPGGNLPPVESTKPVLLRPQDKYCPSSEADSQVPEPAPVHRKKKDKFSRYDCSGSESDDESEDDSEDEQPTRPLFVPANEEEEEAENKSASDNLANSSHEEQPSTDTPDADISLAANKEEEQEFDELEEPVSVLDNLGEVEEVKEASEPELNEEEEERLLAHSPTRDSSEDNLNTAVVDSPTEKQQSETSPKNESAPGGSEKGDESDLESSSDNDSESGNESDTSSSSSSSSDSNKSDNDVCDSGSQKNSGSENESEEKNMENSSQHQDSDECKQASDSHSESEEETSIRRLPAKSRLSPTSTRSPSPKKTEEDLTPEQQAKLEARKRKFESSQEVQLTGNKKISLKGIVPKTNKKTKPQRPSSAERQSPLLRQSSPERQISSTQKQNVSSSQRLSSVSVPKTSDSHRKRSRRKVSLETPATEKPSSESEEEASDSEDDNDDENGSRSWMREGNRTAAHRKTVNVDKPLPGSGGSYRGNSYQRGSRNGGYHQRGYEPSRDTRPEIHYSSSEEEEEDNDRKLISVVVPRSSAGTRVAASGVPASQTRERDSVRGALPNRKRTGGSSGGLSHGGDRSSISKSKHFQDSGSFNVVITGDPVPPKRSRADGTRVPVHERLGKTSQLQKDLSGRGKGRLSKRPTSASDEEGGSGHNELDQRIRRIKKNNAAIIRRQEEVRQDRELYG